MDSTSVEFTCICKKFKVWVTDGNDTKPCPGCGRIYIGKYNPKTYGIDGIEKGQLAEVKKSHFQTAIDVFSKWSKWKRDSANLNKEIKCCEKD